MSFFISAPPAPCMHGFTITGDRPARTVTAQRHAWTMTKGVGLSYWYGMIAPS